jgi:hypothetical protein
MHATELWRHWQALLAPCACAFTYPGFQRFSEWLPGLALNDEEHTITQSLVGLGRPADWKALESFAAYGAWNQDALEQASAELLDTAPGRLWHGYHVWAGDDRSSCVQKIPTSLSAAAVTIFATADLRKRRRTT